MKQTQRHSALETILVLVLALDIFYWYYKKPFLLLTALALGLTGLLIPPAGKMIHRLWTGLAEALGFVMNKIILGLIFIIVVIPLGLVSRKISKSSIKLKPGNDSYFKDRDHVFVKEDVEKPW